MGLPFEYFLSELDEGLSRTSSRDPLGLEVLWTAFGRRLIPHLSTVSLGATNFAVLLVLLDAAQRYGDQRRDGGLGFADLMVAVDSLQVYAVLEAPTARTTSRLLGRQRAARIADAGTRLIGPGHEILANQINLGLYGRYIKPLESMELIDGQARLLVDAAALVDSLPGVDGVRHSIDAFLRLLDRGEPVPFAQFTGGAALRELREPTTLAHFGELLRARMRIDEASDHRVRRIYEALAPYPAASPQVAQVVFATLADDPAVQDARDLEWALCRLETVFETVFCVNTLPDLAAFPGITDVVADLERAGELLAELGGRKELSAAGVARIEALRDAAGGGSAEEVARRLVRYHEGIMVDRRRSPWVDITDGGRLVVVHAGSETTAAEPRWRRSYYLSSLAEFRTDMTRMEAS